MRKSASTLATTLALATAMTAAFSAHAETPPSNAELYEIIKALKAEVESLKAQQARTNAAAPPAPVAQLEASVEAQQQRIAALEQNQGRDQGLGKFSLGGYGELHYNNLENDNNGAKRRELDLHRFVLYTGYKYNDSIRFRSELEIEHSLAGDGSSPNGSKAKPGEVELEQAYLEFDLPYQASAKAGLFLLPIGIINETHEPPSFYGVERNPVETAIIPATWWEGGAGLSGRIGNTGLAYNWAVHSGLALPTTGANAYRIRNGRQKVAEARADALASSFGLQYTGVLGLKLAAAIQYQQDATQAADNEDVNATLLEAHAIYNYKKLELRGLYAAWDLDGAGASAAGRSRQAGYYGEFSYKPLPQLGLFTRYSDWDNGGSTAKTAIRQTDIGFNYWPISDVVLKADYQWQNSHLAGSNFKGLNLGVGYQF